MNKTMKGVLAALLAAGTTSAVVLPAHAQVADQNTSVTGGPVYVEAEDVDLPLPSGHNGLNISGEVGLPLNPTAQTPAKGSVRVQANYYQLYNGSNDSLIEADSKLYGVYVAGGLTDRLEVSAGLEKQAVSGRPVEEDLFDRSGVALGVKYLLGKQNNPDDVRFAIGAGYSRALYKNTHIYGVASKNFGTGRRVVTGHLGVRWDRFRTGSGGLGFGDFESSRVSVFAGAEVPIDRRGRFALVGELQSKNADSDFGGAAPYSVSVRYRSDNGFSASVGLMRQGVLADFVDDDSGLFAQVGKTF